MWASSWKPLNYFTLSIFLMRSLMKSTCAKSHLCDSLLFNFLSLEPRCADLLLFSWYIVLSSTLLESFLLLFWFCLHLVYLVYAFYILDFSITSIIICFFKMSCKPMEIIIIRLQLASMLWAYVTRQRWHAMCNLRHCSSTPQKPNVA